MSPAAISVRPDSSKLSESTDARGWVLYDARCALCRGAAHRLGCVAVGRGFRLRPLQLRWVQAELARRAEPVGDEILLLLPDGRLLGGVDVYAHLGFRIWWGWPLAALVSVPGVRLFAGKLYAWVAANRYRLSRARARAWARARGRARARTRSRAPARACEGDRCRAGR